MIQRAFPNDPPRITFTKDRAEFTHGDLLPGRQTTIWYDAERFPFDWSDADNPKPCQVTVFARFSAEGPVYEWGTWSETGKIVPRFGDTARTGSMWSCQFTVPSDASELIVWFRGTDPQGNVYWDSKFGENFHFRFTSLDLQLKEAVVTTTPGDPGPRFHLTVGAIPAATGVRALYWFTSDPANVIIDREFPLSPSGPPDAAGYVTWTSEGLLIPHGAVVDYAVAYEVNGITCRDTNSGKGYLAWEQ